jgi:hypothetical protein
MPKNINQMVFVVDTFKIWTERETRNTVGS